MSGPSRAQDADAEILAAARDGFLEEARDLLRQFEEALLGLDERPGDAELVNAAFRAAHTIKGTAGLFGYERVVAFTHDVETLLEAMRAGQHDGGGDAIALLLASRDRIEQLLEHGQDGEPDAEAEADAQALSRRLAALLGRASGAAPTSAARAETPAPTGRASRRWHVRACFGVDALRNGLDPLSFLRYLGTRGTVEHALALFDDVPPLEALDPESCHLGFEVIYAAELERAEIEQFFEFAIDDCTLSIEPIEPAVTENADRVDDDAASLIAAAPAAAVTAAARPGHMPAPHAAVPSAGERRSGRVDRRQPAAGRRGEEARFVRVSADKLDRLIDLVGELVIASSGAEMVAGRGDVAAFAEASARIHALVESTRDGAMALRMVPIGETFARFHRVVRDLCKTLGKEVELQITGGDTELDKAMVEVIADPLVHLVRNSLDHGIETPEERVAAGKPTRGRIALNAYHEAGQIVIEVSDDGRGLDRPRILAKAIERGLVHGGEALGDHEIDQLICAPGFSTAEQVTDLSGRGVGMDVVKRSIEALRGQMRLASDAGRGMTTQIRLPLTLAIIGGFLTSVASVHYVLPLELVAECIELPRECLTEPGRRTGHFELRGRVLPWFDLRLLHADEPAPAGRRSLVVLRHGDGHIGCVVDKLHGEYQTVIKPLGELFRHLRPIAGSTVLGSGQVALVLDVPALVAHVTVATRHAAASAAPHARPKEPT